jgi:REP element-mobilizing transposase RayT
VPGPLNHQPPPWISSDTRYLITACAYFRVRNTFCHPEVGAAILDSIRLRDERNVWYCDLAVLMPDHIHLILHVPDETPLATVIRNWKSWLAKAHGIRWQKNFFDHRLRSEDEAGAKAQYVWNNPVRAGLVKRTADWPYVWLADGFVAAAD